jgi:hypothetical protein
MLCDIPRGWSVNDLKAGGRVRVPGLENDSWRFLVEVLILMAGSPYGVYLSVDVFRLYTQAMAGLYTRGNDEIVAKILVATGGGCVALAIVFLLILLLVYKFRASQLYDSISAVTEVTS